MTKTMHIHAPLSTPDALPLISLSIPVLNEADNLDALYARVDALSKHMANRCRMEFVFTDNHSSDSTWGKLSELASRDPRIRAVRFSKNFGFQRSILANYMHSRGDAIMQLDADMQDPPEMLEQFFELWRNGHDVVYGIRAKRQESGFMNILRKMGYWLIDKISEHPIPRDAGDFRLIDRKVLNALLKYKSSTPYLRGMIAGMGFRQVGLQYERDARKAGESKFNLWQVMRLGFTGVFNHSVVPLRLATFAGVVLLGMSALGSLYYLLLKILRPNLPQGLASVHMLVLFGIGFQSLLLGIIGEYIRRIYVILRSEPVAIVEQSLNINEGELKL